MFCPSCGKTNPDDSKFCEACGANLTDPTAVAAPAAPIPQPAAPVAPVYQQPAAPAYVPPAYQQPVPQAQYYAPQQPAYQASADPKTKPLSVLGYLGTMIVLALPIIGIVMLFVWSFGSGANLNRKNFCRAYLILAIIAIIITIIFSIFFATVIPDLFEQFGYDFSWSTGY